MIILKQQKLKIVYFTLFCISCFLFSILFFSCRNHRISKKDASRDERLIYNKLFEESEQILKKNIFIDNKWVNIIYTKNAGKIKFHDITNITFIKNSIVVETADATLYKFDKNSGEIKWITKLEFPQKGSSFFYYTQLETTIVQYEKLLGYYDYCITNIKECVEEIERKRGVKIKDMNLQKRIYETLKFELERKISNFQESFFIYTLRDLRLIGIDFYSGSVRFTKYLPSLPVGQPIFFDGNITYFSSDRNRFVWVNPVDFTEEFQIIIDSLPNFVKVLSKHILTQDRNSVKYFDNRKLYWSIELDTYIIDAIDIHDYAFLLTSDNELILINLLTGNIEWKALLRKKAKKLSKYAGYLFIKLDNAYQLIDLKDIAKLLESSEEYYKRGSYYELRTKKIIDRVSRFLFGDKDYLYFLGTDKTIKKFKTDTLDNIENIQGLSEYKFIWEHGSKNVLLFKKPSSLYYFTFSR